MVIVTVPTKPITPESNKEDIEWVQKKFNEMLPEISGIIPLKIDGDYGPKTRIATLIYWDMLGWGNQMKYDGTKIGNNTINALAAGQIK
jgi:N-acetylmuramoyl-L-alanine amidase